MLRQSNSVQHTSCAMKYLESTGTSDNGRIRNLNGRPLMLDQVVKVADGIVLGSALMPRRDAVVSEEEGGDEGWESGEESGEQVKTLKQWVTGSMSRVARQRHGRSQGEGGGVTGWEGKELPSGSEANVVVGVPSLRKTLRGAALRLCTPSRQTITAAVPPYRTSATQTYVTDCTSPIRYALKVYVFTNP